VTPTCEKRLKRLKTIVSLQQEKQDVLAHIRAMRDWVREGEHIFDGSWASQPQEISNAEVERRLDDWLHRLATFLESDQRTEDVQLRLGHLLKVMTHLRPGLVQCSDREGFPRTNNDMERTIRAIKMHYRRISGRKNWNSYLLRYDRCVAYQQWWQQQPDGTACLHARLKHGAPAAFRRVRQDTRERHQEQLNYRFRHRPLASLQALEVRWEYAACT
jgi:hypothetical protein